MPNELKRSARLLVVDDQETNLQILGALLKRLGFEIVVASDCDQALACLKAQPIDLILLDLLMPDHDGFEVCALIKAQPAWVDIPIIFLSAADDKSLIVRALESGGVDYVTKPFNQAELQSRVQTHIALKAARDRLKRLAEDKDEILGILTHDLKNHLNVIKVSVELLTAHSETQNDKRLDRMASLIQTATIRMLDFVEEFLANASADRDFLLNLEPICLNNVTSEVTQRYTETARRKQITLQQSGSTDTLITADRKGLDQVLDNLVSNAIKFSDSGKTVSITIESAPEGGAICQIKDEGPGFTEEDKSRMFRRYHRLSAMPTAGEPSTGLGLSIVKKLMTAMNAEIECTSEPGRGATFQLKFQAAVSSS